MIHSSWVYVDPALTMTHRSGTLFCMADCYGRKKDEDEYEYEEEEEWGGREWGRKRQLVGHRGRMSGLKHLRGNFLLPGLILKFPSKHVLKY